MQTSINKAGQPVAVAGQLVDNGHTNVVSRFNQDTNQVPFGTGVKAGTSSHGVVQPTANTDVIEGISVWGFSHQPANAAGTIGDIGATGLLTNAGLQVLRSGRIYVLLDAGVSSVAPYTDRAYCRCTANGGNTVIGAWSNASDGSNSIDCTKQVQFTGALFTAADGTSKIAEVEVNFVNKP